MRGAQDEVRPYHRGARTVLHSHDRQHAVYSGIAANAAQVAAVGDVQIGRLQLRLPISARLLGAPFERPLAFCVNNAIFYGGQRINEDEK